MKSFNYFQIVCFLWAALGIGSRLAMAIMGKRWKEWELNSAYKDTKPIWIYVVGVLGYLIVGYTWYQVIVSNIKFSWIIALLITSTVFKISTLLFNYQTFRRFAIMMLNDRKKMSLLNVSVLVLSTTLILMGVFLY